MNNIIEWRKWLVAAWAITAASCAMTAAQVSEKRLQASQKTDRSYRDAVAKALVGHTLRRYDATSAAIMLPNGAAPERLENSPAYRVVETITEANGLVDGETVVRLAPMRPEASAERLGFRSRLDARYEATTDMQGNTVVLRMVATTVNEHLRQKGTCGFGHGTEPIPPQPGALLAEETSTQLRVIAVPYDKYTVSVDCDRYVEQP